MSAPKNAEPLGSEGWSRDGKPLTSDELPRCSCEGCGWRGSVAELLAVDDEETLWCPSCRGATWVYD